MCGILLWLQPAKSVGAKLNTCTIKPKATTTVIEQERVVANKQRDKMK